MKQLIIALALGLSVTASAGIKAAPPKSTMKTQDAVYTLGVPQTVDIGVATEKAFAGAKVYKCQEVELQATKSGASLKPVKVAR